jgi:hypothetical protein
MEGGWDASQSCMAGRMDMSSEIGELVQKATRHQVMAKSGIHILDYDKHLALR